jgi:hypothetical protein
LASYNSLLFGYAQTVCGDVFSSGFDLAPVLFTFVAVKVGCDAVCLHMSDCSAFPAVLLDTTKALIEGDNAIALEIIGNLLHALAGIRLPLVSTERDLEGRDQGSTRIIRRCVGVTMLESKRFYEAPKANLLVPRHQPVALVTGKDLRVDVAYYSADRIHIKSDCF